MSIEFEVVYEFSLCLMGKQPGKLLYTTSLIPQEELKIYISDRLEKQPKLQHVFLFIQPLETVFLLYMKVCNRVAHQAILKTWINQVKAAGLLQAF